MCRVHEWATRQEDVGEFGLRHCPGIKDRGILSSGTTHRTAVADRRRTLETICPTPFRGC